MASFESLISNLAADDLSIRLYAILTLHDRKDDSLLLPQLEAAAASETDPSLKLYLTWLANPDKNAGKLTKQQMIAMLDSRNIDWVSFFYSLHIVDRNTAAIIIPRIRRLDTSLLPVELLPMLVQFFQRYGTAVDTDTLVGWCSSSNPVVMSLAIEALSRIQPERLKSLLLPLLSNQSPGIRSRAIRLLYRWYPEEAPRHLAEMLNSEVVDDRRAALANAYFLPFDTIKFELLRFIIKEESSALLQQAGNILIINPDVEVAKVTASIAVNTTPEKRPVICQILRQQAEFLFKAGIIQTEPAEATARLLFDASKQRQNITNSAQNSDQQADMVRQRIQNDPENAVAWLKLEFSTDLPTPVLQAMVENLAVLEPEFLAPFLPELLRSAQLPIQVASLIALSRISPAKAEKLLEQCIFSAVPARRHIGFQVLSLMEKAFAAPLMIKAFARENDPELLTFYLQKFPQPIDKAFLIDLLKESQHFSETHSHRLPLIESLCEQHKIKMAEIANFCGEDNDFLLEKVMVNRAAVEAIADAASLRLPDLMSQAKERIPRNTLWVEQYEQKSNIGRMLEIQKSFESADPSEDELNALLSVEKHELLRFLIKVGIRKKISGRNDQFSPVALLQQNLNRPSPEWLNVAVGLVSLNNRPARLAAPLLQNRQWFSWPAEILPAVLTFIGKTSQPLFSATVTTLLQHQQPEVRFSAIQCLEKINPEELRPILPELLRDNCIEITLLAKQLKQTLDSNSASKKASTRCEKSLNSNFPMQNSILAFIVAAILYLFIFGNAEQHDGSVVTTPSDKKLAKKVARFTSWQESPKAGQERTVFGKVNKVFADSILIFSSGLQKPVMIRFGSIRPVLKENDHFNGKVEIDLVNNERVEATLLEPKEIQ